LISATDITIKNEAAVQLLVVTDFEGKRYAIVRSSKSEVTKTVKAIILYHH
jgi:hypothetical protein